METFEKERGKQRVSDEKNKLSRGNQTAIGKGRSRDSQKKLSDRHCQTVSASHIARYRDRTEKKHEPTTRSNGGRITSRDRQAGKRLT
jgi:hypothetical protein